MKNFLFILIAIFFVACSNSQGESDSIETLKKDVIGVHDEVMPKMGELRSLEKKLRTKADTLTGADSMKHIAAADAIRKANEDMMSWMRSYDPNFEGSDEEMKKYLEDQKKSIDKVKQDMLNSLDSGKLLIEAN